MIKYLYMYNVDGTDYLNPNVFEDSESKADDMMVATTMNEDNLEYGTPVKVYRVSEFKTNILSMPKSLNVGPHSFPINKIYFGYYYDPKTEAYIIDNNAVCITKEQSYQQVFETMVDLKILKPTDYPEHEDEIDAEDIVCEHEGDAIEVDKQTLNEFLLRMQED